MPPTRLSASESTHSRRLPPIREAREVRRPILEKHQLLERDRSRFSPSPYPIRRPGLSNLKVGELGSPFEIRSSLKTSVGSINQAMADVPPLPRLSQSSTMLGSRMDVDSSPESPGGAAMKRKRSDMASDHGDCTDAAASISSKRVRPTPVNGESSRDASDNLKREGAPASPTRNFLRVLTVIEETVRDAVIFAYEEGLAQGLKGSKDSQSDD